MVFLDTNAFAALVNPRDQNHAAIIHIYQRLLEENHLLLTSNFVLDETYTLVRRRVSHAAAAALMETIARSSIRIRRITEEHETMAAAIFLRYAEHAFSFTDCTSFALIETDRIPLVLTVDRDFRHYRFRHPVRIIPELAR